MRSNDKDNVVDIIHKICEKKAERSHVIALLIIIREHLPSYLPSNRLLDLSHCVAHTQRDRGYTFEYFAPVANRLVSAIKRGGTIPVFSVLPIKEIIADLHTTLEVNGIKEFSLHALLEQEVYFQNLLITVIDGISFDIANANIVSCKFVSKSTDPDVPFPLSFGIKLTGLSRGYSYSISEGAIIYFPVF